MEFKIEDYHKYFDTDCRLSSDSQENARLCMEEDRHQLTSFDDSILKPGDKVIVVIGKHVST